MSDWLLITLGLGLLVVSAEVLVRGAVWIARAAGIRPMVVGLTVVAFGTSAPELAACLAGALDARPGLATGTVLGSNVANIALILGLAAMMAPVERPGASARYELGWLLVLTLLIPVPMLLWQQIPRWWGVGLLISIIWFTWSLIRRERQQRVPRTGDEIPHGRLAAVLHATLALAGIVGLKYGAELLVEGAVGVGKDLGVSDQVISSVFIAVGTSLPELAASVMAAIRRHPEIALGNVIGSNLFNIGMVLGTTAAIAPLPFTWEGEGPHVVVGIALTLALVLLLRYFKHITRVHGAAMLVFYVGYLTFTVWRG